MKDLRTSSGMDRAGAQTRYGEAKKSFGKATSENVRCETIYLASCFTDAVLEQIAKDRQVRKHFNLVDILADDDTRDRVLMEWLSVADVVDVMTIDRRPNKRYLVAGTHTIDYDLSINGETIALVP